MNCMICQAQLNTSPYCPKCGCNVTAQKKAVALSNLYYNQGLEKAQIRDLSGAITCLKRSLKMNKCNIQARNLLGLVYFETGEVVAALSEWVISKNIMPDGNVASDTSTSCRAMPTGWTPSIPASRNITSVSHTAVPEIWIWLRCSLRRC